MKILATEQTQNIEVVTEYKLSLDSKLRSRASIQMAKINSTRIRKKKKYDTEMEKNVNYRSNHFYKPDELIYCYTPRHFIRSPICYLYCEQKGCKSWMYLDMDKEKGRTHGKHNHDGIDIEQYIEEFPEIKQDDWIHMQYDIKDNKKIFIWKN